MAKDGERMRKALKAHLLPAISALGFVGSANQYRRLRDDRQDLLAVQYWKYGGSFLLEFGHRPRGDLHTAWGDVVPEDRVTVVYLPVADRARLVDRGAADDDLFRGFRFDAFGDDGSTYDTLARHVTALLPQVDRWLRTGQVGPDLDVIPAP
jgi:hypothetical protein